MISENERFYVFGFYDNGSGVGEEHIPTCLSGSTVSAADALKTGGTGLGLPIVKSTIDSPEGQSRFTTVRKAALNTYSHCQNTLIRLRHPHAPFK